MKYFNPLQEGFFLFHFFKTPNSVAFYINHAFCETKFRISANSNLSSDNTIFRILMEKPHP
jgi:hypothetical protein